jgi:hypothetical protein
MLLIRFVDRVHPMVKNGKLPEYDSKIPFWQSVLRHVAYGGVLGGIYGERVK